MFVRLALGIIALCAVQVPASANEKVMIFGGKNHDQYLGCIVCSELASDSICNGYGQYGNEFGSKGMFNEFAGFGNEFSSKSPWNEFSLSKEVPVLVDSNGSFYGYFTTNTARSDAAEISPLLKSLHDRHSGNLEKVRVSLCEAFGYSG